MASFISYTIGHNLGATVFTAEIADQIDAEARTEAEIAAGVRLAAEEASAAKSEFIANVSHELQTPLVSVRGYTEMILKGRLGRINDEQKQGLSLSLRNIDRLIAISDERVNAARERLRDAKERI